MMGKIRDASWWCLWNDVDMFFVYPRVGKKRSWSHSEHVIFPFKSQLQPPGDDLLLSFMVLRCVWNAKKPSINCRNLWLNVGNSGKMRIHPVFHAVVLNAWYIFPFSACACRGPPPLNQTRWKQPWPKTSHLQGAFEEQLADLQVLAVDGNVKNVPWWKRQGPNGSEGCRVLVSQEEFAEWGTIFSFLW